MHIRPERKEEFPQIYTLVEEAFKTAKVADGDEQDFVDMLRAGDKYVPELALVAEEDGELIGHIMLTEAMVRDSGGSETPVLLLAPVSVALGRRSRGVGGTLIEESFRRAREMGYRAVFLLGDPAYYNRFGFRPADDFGIRYHVDVPAEYFLGIELVPDGLDGVTGIFVDDYVPPEK